MSTELRPTPETEAAFRKLAAILDRDNGKKQQGETIEETASRIQERATSLILERDKLASENRRLKDGDSKKASGPLVQSLLDQLEAQAAQIEAMRDAIKEAHDALTDLDQCRIFYGDSMDIDSHVTDACATARAKLKPLLP